MSICYCTAHDENGDDDDDDGDDDDEQAIYRVN